VTFTFDLLTSKVVSESRVTWATSVPILVFLGLSVLDLVRRQTDRQTDRRQTPSSLYAPPIKGGGIIIVNYLSRLPISMSLGFE